MKPTFRLTTISSLLSILCLCATICSSNVAAQTSGQTLDQVSLLMQFKGTWQGEYGGKDTLLIWQTKPIANNKGLYSYAKLTYQGKILLESWAIYAYDPEIRKVVWFELLSDGTVLPYRGEFSSPTTLDINIYSKAGSDTIVQKARLQFRTADTIDASEINPVSGVTKSSVFKRTKRQ